MDVEDSNWYYSDVLYAIRLGLVNGKSETEYKPEDNLTYAEAIKLAACMHQLYTTGEITLKNGNPWYQSYVDYCVDNSIINKEYNYNEKATRSGYMVIFANALPDEALEEVNNVPNNSIPDVPMMRAFSSGVYKLYRAGILQGSDDEHNCKPLDNIKRSEVATILARMMDKTKRVKFTLGEEEPEEVNTLAIKTQPANVSAKTGDAVSFTVEAEGGKAPYTYSWQVRDCYEDWEEVAVSWIASAKQETLSFNVHQEEFENEYSYRCVITDSTGDKVTSKAVNVTKKSSGGAKDNFEQADKEELKNEEFLMYVEDVFINEDMRRYGTGGKLFDQARKIAQEEHCARLECKCLDWNDSAKKFYEKIGGVPSSDEWITYTIESNDF